MSNPKEQIIFIVNPLSGLVHGGGLLSEVKRYLNTSRMAPLVIKCASPIEAKATVDKYLKEGTRRFVAVGGDGTINVLASLLVNTNACLGIIPWGSGNGLARHLGIPLQTKRAIKLLNRERLAMIDYGLVNETPFFCTSGIGFDAHVGDLFNHFMIRGFIGYIHSTAVQYFKYSPKNYRVSFGGTAIEREAFVITIANASQFGYNAFIAPHADIADGLFDVTIISPFPTLLAPSLGLKLFTKKINRSKYVEAFRAKEITIEHDSPCIVHFDGETLLMDRKQSYKCNHLGLNVFVP